MESNRVEKADIQQLWQAHNECQKEQAVANDKIRDEVAEVRNIIFDIKEDFASMKATVETMLKDNAKTTGQVETIKKIMWGLLGTALVGCCSIIAALVMFILEYIVKK